MDDGADANAAAAGGTEGTTTALSSSSSSSSSSSATDGVPRPPPLPLAAAAVAATAGGRAAANTLSEDDAVARMIAERAQRWSAEDSRRVEELKLEYVYVSHDASLVMLRACVCRVCDVLVPLWCVFRRVYVCSKSPPPHDHRHHDHHHQQQPQPATSPRKWRWHSSCGRFTRSSTPARHVTSLAPPPPSFVIAARCWRLCRDGGGVSSGFVGSC